AADQDHPWRGLPFRRACRPPELIRLFFKLYGVLIATLAISFVVQMQLMDYAWRHVASSMDAQARFRPTFHLIEEALAPLPPELRGTRLAQLSQEFGVPARIEPWEDFARARGEN